MPKYSDKNAQKLYEKIEDYQSYTQSQSDNQSQSDQDYVDVAQLIQYYSNKSFFKKPTKKDLMLILSEICRLEGEKCVKKLKERGEKIKDERVTVYESVIEPINTIVEQLKNEPRASSATWIKHCEKQKKFDVTCDQLEAIEKARKGLGDYNKELLQSAQTEIDKNESGYITDKNQYNVFVYHLNQQSYDEDMSFTLNYHIGNPLRDAIKKYRDQLIDRALKDESLDSNGDDIHQDFRESVLKIGAKTKDVQWINKISKYSGDLADSLAELTNENYVEKLRDITYESVKTKTVDLPKPDDGFYESIKDSMHTVYKNSTARENELEYSLNIPEETFSLSTEDISKNIEVKEWIDNIVSRNFHINDRDELIGKKYSSDYYSKLYLQKPGDPFYGLDDSSGVSNYVLSKSINYALYNSFVNGDKPISDVLDDINEVKNTRELNEKCSKLNQSRPSANNTRPRLGL
ncbi:MAG: hypothetical protein VX112_04225 [Pseudomonadota bacterium]|nr:hypothetical protein [Pseudomonadota bacterium]